MTKQNREVIITSPGNGETLQEKKRNLYEFEIVLEHIGQIGKYQALLAIFLLYSVTAIGMQALSVLFVMGIPPHRCHLPEVDDNPIYRNVSEQDLLNLSTPLSYEGYDGCKMYDYNYTTCLDEMRMDCSQTGSNSSIVSCHSYVYNERVVGHTVVSEWDLVCNRLILGTTLNSMYYTGATIGCFLGGSISDKIGRRYVLLISTTVLCAMGIGCSFASNLTAFAVTRTLFAMASSSSYSVGFVYVAEILGQKWRAIAGPAYNTAFGFGYTVLTFISYNLRNWRLTHFTISLCSAPFILICFIIPESPRWLFAKRRNGEGMSVSSMMANKNGSPLPRDIWTKSLRKNEDQHKNKQHHSVLTLFRGRGIRRVTLIMMFVHFAVAITYFGVALNVGTLSGDMYVNNVLSGLAEIVSGPVAMIIMRRYGRRPSTCLSLLISGTMGIASSIANEFAHSSSTAGLLGTSAALCGRLTVSVSYNLIFMFLSELYPTVVRATAFSSASTCALVASIITPYTLHLQNFVSWLPGIIYGTLSILSGFVILRLKETRHHKMMTTTSEAERFYEA